MNVLFSSENGKSTTIWAATHLPQNRDIWATCGGNGSVRKNEIISRDTYLTQIQVHIWKYNYPTSRFEELTTEKGTKERRGVIGNVELVQKQIVATQPISSVDFHPDKCGLAVMSGYDQAVRVVLVTKLNTL